jgi:hypothetical protein
MELPSEVLVHDQILGLKGARGTVLRISTDGYYEVNLLFGERLHRVLLPVTSTVVIQRDPEERVESDMEIER